MKEVYNVIVYGVYDTKDNDVLVTTGTVKEIADYFKTSKAVIHCCVSRKNLRDMRYSVISLYNEKE